MLDLIRRGYVPNLPVSRDTPYDIVVQREDFSFQSVQVKTVRDHTFNCTTRGTPNEVVSRNGHIRSSFHYRDFKIDWIVGVKDNQCFYYPLSVYTLHEKIDIRHVASVDFGVNPTVAPHTTTSPSVPLAPGLFDPYVETL